MSLTVPLLVRSLAELRAVSVDIIRFSDLAAFYRIWGIELSFQLGPDFNYDPTDDPAEVDELRRQYRPLSMTGAAPALMIVAASSEEGSHVNGQLLDTQRRGICAIFTQSHRYRTGDHEARFEIVTHEIGHMLNLVHGFADAPYPTAMNQYDRRATANRRDVWQRHINLAPATARAAIVDFFSNGTRSPIGLPMSPRCHQHLIDSSADKVRPWYSQFSDPFSEGDDVDSPVTCQLSIRRAVIETGQPIDISVTIELNGNAPEPVLIPKGFGLSEGTIELYIHGEHGQRKYIPRKLLCTDGTRLLTSRAMVTRSYSLLRDANGLLFPWPGAYTIEARIPALGARSKLNNLLVDQPTEELALFQLQAFLAAGMPSEDKGGWQLLAQAARNPKIDRAVRAHFFNEIVSRRPMDARIIAGLVSAAKYDSPRTYQKNLLLRLSRMSRAVPGTIQTDAGLLDEAEAALRVDDEQHPSLEFIEKLRRTGVRRGKK